MALQQYTPEIFLSISILFLLVVNTKIINYLKFNYPLIEKEGTSQFFFVLLCVLVLFINLKLEGFFSTFLFSSDEGCRLTKLLVVAFSIGALGFTFQAFSAQRLVFFEFFIVFLLALLSLLLLISSSDLLTLYLMLEMQALCFYVLASFNRVSAFSSEAGLKYFIVGSFFSGLFLFGSSLLYGAFGTLSLNNLCLLFSYTSTAGDELFSLVQVALVLITSTLLFKVACAPFHFWAPDVYDGAPLGATVIFSIVPKVPLFYFFFKWLSTLAVFSNPITNTLLFFGIFSVVLGTLFSLKQKRIKRLIIYSSIAQVGFIVVGLGVNTLGGGCVVSFFLIVYVITALLAWGLITIWYTFQQKCFFYNNRSITPLYLSSLAGFFKLNRFWALTTVFLFFSVAGVPPLLGFLAKVIILFETVSKQFFFVAISLIVISSVSAFYYIRVIKVLFFEPKLVAFSKERFQVVFYNNDLDTAFISLSLCVFFLNILFVFPNGLYVLCSSIMISSFCL